MWTHLALKTQLKAACVRLPETSFSFEIITIVTSYSNQLNQKIKAMGRAIGRLKTATGQPFFSSAAHAV
jgi:hypothetical protein